MSKIKGQELMLFLGGKSIAYATSHTLEISAETADTSNKDEGGGDWASSENLFTTDGNGSGYDTLFDYMIKKTPIDAVFGQKKETAVDVPTQGWTANTTGVYEGKVVITSLSLNAPNGEYATYSVQFTGVGALKKKDSLTAKNSVNVSKETLS